MAPARFGTDGVRGVANEELTPELALALGRGAARVLGAPQWAVGRDTRRSGPLLQAALMAGLASEGVDVVDLGVLPTPGVATVAARCGVPAAMVSASHNPFADNGIKLFSAQGTKLAAPVEAEVEAAMLALLADAGHPPVRPTGSGVGRIVEDPSFADLYRSMLAQATEGRRLDGLTVVVDCANGAAGAFAPAALGALGARVVVLHDQPDGTNINERCGSTDPSDLQAVVVARGADLGLALDGDADRVIAVDGSGALVDGDALLALFALDLAARERLAGGAVVVTVMTNLGFRLAMAARGIAVRATDVGDRHVLAALDSEGLVLGGEQSGHIIFRDRASTGDGILTGILLADLVCRSGRPLAELTSGLVERVPQVLLNVPVAQPARLAGCAAVWEAVAAAEAALGGEGRVLLRPSGTEPVVRVMVEARQPGAAEATANELAELVASLLG